MPPNRKTNVDVVEGIAGLNLVQQVKFPPLTSEIQTKEVVPQQQPTSDNGIIRAAHTKDPSHPANAYWDWSTNPLSDSKQQLIDQILKEEQVRQLLSIEHVEQTVVQNAQPMETETETERAIVVEEDYWFQPPTEEKVVLIERNANLQSYWDWPTKTAAEQKQDWIDSIIEEERCRQLLSVEHVASNLVTVATSPGIVMGAGGADPSYWDW
jgi:hypothetical protein